MNAQPFRLKFRNTTDGWYVCILHCDVPPSFDIELGRILAKVVGESETLQKQFADLMCNTFNEMLQRTNGITAIDFCTIPPGGSVGHG